ncbi:MAG: RNA polymerase factor sigma-54 [Planctomycetota bacterium]|jgi:RNA polymerase sigma-54 factor
MRLDVRQQLRLEQQMKLAPRIIQAMEILQLPMLALQQRIDQELQENPVLELRDPGVDPQEPPAEEEYADDRGERDMVVDGDNGNSEDFERLADFTDEYGMEFVTSDAPAFWPRRPPSGERDRKLDAMANTPAPDESLDEYLLRQWAFVDCKPRVRSAGRLIINHLDEDGYLRVSFGELLAKTNEGLEEDNLREALGLVQTLEPPGVGARDLQECLLIQLRQEAAAGMDVSLETALVSRFLRDIEMNRLPHISKRLGKSLEEIKAGITNMSHLNYRPGLLVGQRRAPIIIPDIIVDLSSDGKAVVTMSDGNTPQLYISKSYRRLARDPKASGDVRKFLQKNVRSAQWLIGAIQQRRQTVRRVAEEVFKAQSDFLEKGRKALKPLPMADVARKVGVHVATVSRAVAGKYVQTPQGIYPLRMFFSGGTTTADGQNVAWDAVKVKLKEIIDAEDKSEPLNDDQLAAELAKLGLKIARRTVAKYRNLLRILPARKRREY